MEAKYGGGELVEAADMELNNTRQQPNESVHEFSDRVHVFELCSRALQEEVKYKRTDALSLWYKQ